MPINRVTKYLRRLMTAVELAAAVDDELENLAANAVSQDEMGVSGTFTTADTPAKTVTVTRGIITKIQ